MKSTFSSQVKLVFLLLITMLLGACATTPYTGRTQVMLSNFDDAIDLGTRASKELLVELDDAIVVNSQSKRLNNIGQNLVKVLEYDPGFKWNFYYVNSKKVNAFAMPDGSIFFYKGIINKTDNDDQLAAIVGHEIAHVVTMHAMESQSQFALGVLVSSLAISGAVLAGGIDASMMYDTFDMSLELYNLLMLKFSRTQEYEADEIGMYIMSDAGYNPIGAAEFWAKMASEDKSTSDFLSTHPLDINRLERINQVMPLAQLRQDNYIALNPNARPPGLNPSGLSPAVSVVDSISKAALIAFQPESAGSIPTKLESKMEQKSGTVLQTGLASGVKALEANTRIQEGKQWPKFLELYLQGIKVPD